MKAVSNNLVTMHPNIHSRPQLPIKGCFGCTEVHLFQFQRVGKGVNATKQKILRALPRSLISCNFVSKNKTQKEISIVSQKEVSIVSQKEVSIVSQKEVSIVSQKEVSIVSTVFSFLNIFV